VLFRQSVVPVGWYEADESLIPSKGCGPKRIAIVTPRCARWLIRRIRLWAQGRKSPSVLFLSRDGQGA